MEHAYTIKEVAEMMRVSRWTVSKWISENRLKAIRPDGTKKYLITESELKKLMRNDYKGGEKDGRR